jgi:glutathione synthase
LELAEQHPNNYLLKPNREGGGHNIFGQEMVTKLKTSSVEEMRSYILMQKIIPVPDIGFKIKDGKVSPSFVQSETGCFGYVLSNDKEVLKYRTGGWMTRTKDA